MKKWFYKRGDLSWEGQFSKNFTISVFLKSVFIRMVSFGERVLITGGLLSSLAQTILHPSSQKDLLDANSWQVMLDLSINWDY